MQRLIAKAYILHQSKMYQPGDELPYDEHMVGAWLEAGSAEWSDTETEPVKTPSPKATSVTAEVGLQGTNVVGSDSEDGIDLVGKVPKTTRRKKK